MALTTNGRCFRVLTFVADCKRKQAALIAETLLSGTRVACELARLFDARGKPVTVVVCPWNAILTFAGDRHIA